MNMIEKRALRSDGYRRLIEPFARARDAFQALLTRAGVPASGDVLLPAYVGWSRKEGSGVFDPVRAVGSRCRFYRVTRSLRIRSRGSRRAARSFQAAGAPAGSLLRVP